MLRASASRLAIAPNPSRLGAQARATSIVDAGDWRRGTPVTPLTARRVV